MMLGDSAMVFDFSKFVLDVDVGKTRKYYDTAHYVSELCSCDGCRNFEKVIDSLSPKVISFFSQLGIDMKKIREVYVNCANADNSIFYGGFYHVCGKLVEGESAWVSVSSIEKHWEEEKTFSITDDFKVSFQEECYMLETNFPLPSIQLEISADIPWVLAEPNNYDKDMTRRRS